VCLFLTPWSRLSRKQESGLFTPRMRRKKKRRRK
jgi:hypothetical protein